MAERSSSSKRAAGWWRALCAVIAFALGAMVTVDAGAEESRRVETFFSLGDSIFNYDAPNDWGYEWPLALEPAGQTSLGIDADSGRSISGAGYVRSGLDAVAFQAAAIGAADAFITDLGVNDGEEGEAWELLAREYVAAIRSIKAGIVIVWIAPVAEPGVAPSAVVERAEDHAATIRALRDEGVIDVVVDWDHYALSHPEVFHTDGVHYWLTGDAAAYARFAAAAVANLTTDGSGPTPTTTSTTVAPTTTSTTVAPTTTSTTVAPTTSRPTVPPRGGGPSTTLETADPVLPTVAPILAPDRCGSSSLPWTVDDDPLDDNIRRLYRTVFARSANTDDLSYWRQQLAIAGSHRSLTRQFIQSPEFADRWSTNEVSPQILEALYENATGAAASAQTRDQWQARLENGTPPADLVWGVAQSMEAVAHTDTAQPMNAVQGAVCRLYLASLGRAPDASGFAHWTSQGDLRQIAHNMSRSPEFLGRFPDAMDDAAFLASVYSQIFDRPIDNSGAQYWRGLLEGGLSRGEAVLRISGSAEYVLYTNTQPS